MNKSIIFLLLIVFASCDDNTLDRPVNLTLSEGFKNPTGFYESNPTFSWHLPVSGDVAKQTAYQIVVASDPGSLPGESDLWDSGKQMTEQSAWIKYDGKELMSRQKVYWQVRYWGDSEEVSGWSEIEHFELGLLDNDDWKAKWIGLDTKAEGVIGSRNNVIHRPQYLRTNFNTEGDVTSARLYITAKGVFDVSINGSDVSDDVMPPGYVPYDKRIETITYDVTDKIASGENTIGVEVAAGWYSGRLGWKSSLWIDTENPKAICQLELTMDDGSKQMVLSDENWKGTTKGPIRLAEIYDGESYDANMELKGWTSNEYDDSDWVSVKTFEVDDKIKLEPKRHSTVRNKIEVKSKELIDRDSTLIFDLKQNMVGVPLLKVPMKKNDTLKIRFAEMLSPDGSFYTKNYRSALSTDYYIAAEDGVIEWSPKFTFHGFRFVELSGYDDSKTASKDWVTGIVQYSDFEQNGKFETSHEKLNQLQSNIVWGLRGNFFDIPTDCPQRDERMGWTGDAQVFGPTSMFNADVYSFWASWMQSVRESQHEDGGIPFVVPDVLKDGQVSSGWGDVSTIIPYKIYFRTGDTKILEDSYEMMKAWVAHHEASSENYISNMNTYGDWLQPNPANGETKGDTSHSLIGTAFFAHSVDLTAKAAAVLGKTEDQQQYEAMFNTVSEAFENEFFDQDGMVKEVAETQTSYLLALAFDLVSEEKKPKLKEYLLQEIKKADNHLRTGFLGTPLLSEVLDETGEIDLMYQLLFNETYPSWFYSINQGATTVWERWNSYSKTEGFNPQNMNSLNHYAYGAIGEWMYERIAGISPVEAGYKVLRIAPIPGGPLTAASASLNTTYGEVSSKWELTDEYFNLDVSIPPNTTAVVIVPKGAASSLKLNNGDFEDNEKVKLTNTNEKSFELTVAPGNYNFRTDTK
ncbi:MAG: family 78 glycoside hydrolase catalytic domain [Leeuwenhoekiella sp.]